MPSPYATAPRLPLPSLLSQVLVAFTIEFDNEFERQMPHRTTRHGATPGSCHAPWLVSLVMWSNCMRFVGDDGVPVGELTALAGTPSNLNGMQRWGFVVVEPSPADRRPHPPRSDWVVRATPAGRMAQDVWRPLFDVIEQRWQARFGNDDIHRLRTSLATIVRGLDVGLPDCLPILGPGLFSKYRPADTPLRRPPPNPDQLPLPALLSRVLLAFAVDFEHQSDLSLAIFADVLRIIDEDGMAVAEVPHLAGVSKEAISMAIGVLEKRRLAVVEPVPTGSRAPFIRLTPKGRQAQDGHHHRLGVIEERWQARFGEDNIRRLRQSLAPLVDERSGERSPLFLGLEPYPDGWRASVRPQRVLPHFPMVLHRGGFPDGS